MANTYKCVRLEPQLNSHGTHKGKVCAVVIGLTAEDGEGNSAYIDGTHSYDADKCPALSTFKTKANALVSQFAADNGWIASLDSQIESRKLQPTQPEEFEAPEITVDTSVEAAEGSHANPTPEPEPEPPAPEEPVVEPVVEDEEEEEEEVEEPVEGE